MTSRALAVLAVVLLAPPAGALVVDIDARDNPPETPVEVSLEPGAYVLVPVDVAGGGAYTATNFWNTVESCNPMGGGCRYGWIWQFVFASDSIPETQVRAPGRWATPELAFSMAFETSFDLYEPETVRFYFTDGEFEDNREGVSLDVVYVPEPARAALLLVGAVTLAAASLALRPKGA